MKNNIDVVDVNKSVLAKLLATENITVEIRPTITAYFDVKTRHLVIPQMKSNLPESLYNLFIGHEVGHAIATPIDAWEQAQKQQNIPHDLLNILEDIRIEKIIKRKYPGIKRDFIDGYNILLDRNFFGIKHTDVNSLNFLDRLNIYSKCGSSVLVYFSPNEQELVNKFMNIETWDDVILYANITLEFLQEQKKKEEELELPASQNSNTEKKESHGISNDKTGGKNSDTENLKFDTSFDLDTVIEQDETSENKQENEPTELSSYLPNETEDDIRGGIGGRNYYDGTQKVKKLSTLTKDDVTSKTQEKLQEKFKEFLDTRTTVLNVYIPEITDFSFIVPYEKILKRVGTQEELEIVLFDTKSSRKSNFTKYQMINKDMVNYMVKEFELKKNAKQLQKIQDYKTGNLNLKKIYSYQFNNDIFKKNAIAPNGQSHGLVIVVDFSASMTFNLNATLMQLFCITDFCQKQKIPFEVFTFTDGGYNGHHTQDNPLRKYKENTIIMQGISMCNILSSKMSRHQYIEMQKLLLSNNPIYMGGTPLNEAIIVAMNYVPKFKEEHKLQIVNTIILTDGAGGSLAVYNNGRGQSLNHYNRIYIHDPVTKEHIIINGHGNENITNHLLKMFRMKTKSHCVGFFLSGSLPYGYKHTKEVYDQFNNDGFYPIMDSGYDEYYIVNPSIFGLTAKSFKFEGDEDSIEQEFKEHIAGKGKGKVMLKRFIKLISDELLS